MITLILLHPLHSTPLQTWTFTDDKSVIQIGRDTDNQVVLHSSVVSRHHAELRKVNDSWELVNLGANGTYVNDKLISQVSIDDGAIVRLAASGPKLQFQLGSVMQLTT